MKEINKNRLVLYLLVIIQVIIGIFLQFNKYLSIYNNYFNPIGWLVISIYAIYIIHNEKKRIVAKTEKTQTVLITIMIYLIIYFLLGLFFGYARSAYSHKLIAIVKNFWAFASVIVFQETARTVMLPNTKIKWYYYVIVILLFSMADINFYNFLNNFSDLEKAFEYVSSILLPTLSKNALFTYLAVIGDYGCNLCYRLPIMVANLLMPLFPDLEWFFTALFDLLLVIIVFIQVNHIHEKKTSRLSRRKIQKERLINKLPILGLTTVFVCFVAGIFRYMPVAIMSNSMADLIVRGDVVVVDKNVSEENLNINDIIQYQLEGSSVVHRIVKIEKQRDQTYYITKGDNNQNVDFFPVTIDQVRGKVLIKVSYIGYPAVLLNELFQDSKPDVEM